MTSKRKRPMTAQSQVKEETPVVTESENAEATTIAVTDVTDANDEVIETPEEAIVEETVTTVGPTYDFFPTNPVLNKNFLHALSVLDNVGLSTTQNDIAAAQKTLYQNIQRILSSDTEEEVTYGFLNEFCKYIVENPSHFSEDDRLLAGFQVIDLSAKQSVEAQRLLTIIKDIAFTRNPTALANDLPWDNISNSLFSPKKETILGNLQSFLENKK